MDITTLIIILRWLGEVENGELIEHPPDYTRDRLRIDAAFLHDGEWVDDLVNQINVIMMSINSDIRLGYSHAGRYFVAFMPEE